MSSFSFEQAGFQGPGMCAPNRRLTDFSDVGYSPRLDQPPSPVRIRSRTIRVLSPENPESSRMGAAGLDAPLYAACSLSSFGIGRDG